MGYLKRIKRAARDKGRDGLFLLSNVLELEISGGPVIKTQWLDIGYNNVVVVSENWHSLFGVSMMNAAVLNGISYKWGLNAFTSESKRKILEAVLALKTIPELMEELRHMLENGLNQARLNAAQAGEEVKPLSLEPLNFKTSFVSKNYFKGWVYDLVQQSNGEFEPVARPIYKYD